MYVLEEPTSRGSGYQGPEQGLVGDTYVPLPGEYTVCLLEGALVPSTTLFKNTRQWSRIGIPSVSCSGEEEIGCTPCRST